MIRPFDEYVSLGGNCEIAFQIRRVLGRDQASVFSWWFVSVPELLAVLRDRFAQMLKPENLEPWPGHMVRDAAYGYKFHSPFSTEAPRDDLEFDKHLAEHRAKVDHLIRKLYEPTGPRAYFLKLLEPASDAELAELVDHLKSIGGTFALVILTVEPRSVDLGPNVYFRTLDRFAPIERAFDGHEPSWDRLCAEFPHVDLIAS